MSVAYWVVAGALAVFYVYSGGIKVVRTPDQLRPMMAWIDSVPLPAVRAIGLLELLGAMGLILPPLTGVAVILAVLAAIGLVVVQVGAVVLHVSRGELSVIGLNAVLLLAAAASVWLATTWT